MCSTRIVKCLKKKRLSPVSYTHLFVLGAGALISGVIDLLIGIFGLRGAKDPRKIGPFFVFSIIGLVLSILNLIISLTSGVSDLTTIGSNIVSVALLIGCVVLANKVRQIH